jgi:ABC-type bacteriocin/lantibiotic exporter with double-glycine peptidase domain
MIIHLIKNLFILKKIEIFYIQFLIIFFTISEIMGLALIMPFVSILNDPSYIQNNNYLSLIYNNLQFDNYSDFIVQLGILIVLILLFSAIFNTYVTWKIAKFSYSTGVELGDNLFSYYINQKISFFSKTNSSTLKNNINLEAQRVMQNIIHPLLTINSKVIFSLSLISVMIYSNLEITIIGILLFIIIYGFLYFGVKKILRKNGIQMSRSSNKRFKIMSEGFQGIKELKIFDLITNFENQFKKNGKIFSKSLTINSVLNTSPRYFIELIIFSLFIFYLIYSVSSVPDKFQELIPTLTFFAVAGFKLLPNFQQIYNGISNIAGSMNAYENIYEELNTHFKNIDKVNKNKNKYIKFKNLTLRNVSFGYENNKLLLKKFNLTINKGNIIGIFGPSGTGKTSLLDIISGFRIPKKGNVLLNSNIDIFKNLNKWYEYLGYVSQNVFLLDETVKKNITLKDNKLTGAQKNLYLKILRRSKLEFLKKKDRSKVGERGVRFSGGQIQRISIARALFKDPEIFIFDEITNSLDSKTENRIIQTMKDLSKEGKTIIFVSHNKSFKKICDKIVDTTNFRYNH